MKYTDSAYEDKLMDHVSNTVKVWPDMLGTLHISLDKTWQINMIKQLGMNFNYILSHAAHRAIYRYYVKNIVRHKPDTKYSQTPKQQETVAYMAQKYKPLEDLIYKIPITFSINKKMLKTQQISELASSDIGKFVAVQVSIVGAGDRLARLSRVKASLNGEVMYYQATDFKAGKKYDWVVEEWEYVQYLTVEEINQQKKSIQSYKLTVRLPDNLVGTITETKKYIITGFYEVETAGDAGQLEQSLYLNCVSITNIKTQKTRTLSASEKTKYRDMAATEPEKYIKMMTDSYAPHIYQNDLGKLGLLLGYLKAVDLGDYRSEIFTVLVGSPGGGKSELLRFMEKILDDFVYIDSQGATTRGLLFSQSEWKKQKILHRGVLLKYQNVAIDEFDKFWKPQQMALNTVIEQRVTTYNASPFNEKAEITCNIAIGANPKNSRWIAEKGIMKNLESVGTTIVDRGLIIKISANTDIKNKLGHIFSNILDKDQLTTPLTVDKLAALYTYASEQIPVLDSHAADTITDFLTHFASIDQDSEQDLPIETRKELDLVRLSIKMAQLLLKKKVDDTAVRLAIQFYKECLKSVGMNTAHPTSTSRLETWQGKTTDVFWVMYNELSNRTEDGHVYISQLKAEMGKTERWKSVEHINMFLDSLEKQGKIFESMPGEYKKG